MTVRELIKTIRGAGPHTEVLIDGRPIVEIELPYGQPVNLKRGATDVDVRQVRETTH